LSALQTVLHGRCLLTETMTVKRSVLLRQA
jgi:hypothetical protein